MEPEGVSGSVNGAVLCANGVRTFLKYKSCIPYQAIFNFNRIGFVNLHNAAKISAARSNKKKYNKQ